VSAYATKNPKEFVAEVYAGKLDGRTYSREVEELYRKMAGPEVRLPLPVPPEWSMPRGTLRRPDLGPGGQLPLPDMPMPTASERPMDAAVKRWKAEQSQAEYERIKAIDSQGMIDSGTALTASISQLHPAGNLIGKLMKLVANPSFKQLDEIVRSFSFDQGGASIPGGSSLAGVEGMLFDPGLKKTAEQLAAQGRKGGLARARNLAEREAAEAKELARDLKMAKLLERERSNGQTRNWNTPRRSIRARRFQIRTRRLPARPFRN